MLIAGSRMVVMPLFPFPAVVSFACPAVFHAGDVFIPEFVRVDFVSVFVEQLPAVLMDELQDGLFGFVIMFRTRGKEEFPAAGAFSDVHFLINSFSRLFDFIG